MMLFIEFERISRDLTGLDFDKRKQPSQALSDSWAVSQWGIGEFSV